MKRSSINGDQGCARHIAATLNIDPAGYLQGQEAGPNAALANARSAMCQISAAQLRPSTVLRKERLRALISELSTRDMDLIAMSLFLECSQSAVRQYVRELLHRAVIVAPGAKRSLVKGRIKAYRLTADPRIVDRFLTSLSDSQGTDPTSLKIRREAHELLGHGAYFHIMWGKQPAACEISRVQPQRDPLVAALFGAGGPRK